MHQSTNSQALGLTDVVLRDAHQSLLATRLRIDDILPIAPLLDKVGFWSLESWGGATFDACIRFLGEDPWARLRRFKEAMPNTPQQMLLRGQNLLGYRHYADDVVDKFVERAAVNGVDIFRIFDALNDLRNIETAVRSVIKQSCHAQGTIAYTISPVHNLDLWHDMALRIQDMGAHSLCIKDMAGLVNPYTGFELISRLKESLEIPIHMQCHATTGLSTATYLKAVEAGIDNLDTAISSLSMTYGHTATETMVSMLEGTPRDTGLDLTLLEKISAWFREVRKKYARFEGRLKGVDPRILIAQAPGGMLTNLENQLRLQQASSRFDEVMAEIPRVRKDLGYIPLVTPTSQIVGTQAVLNVLAGKRYANIAKETTALLKGEYGTTPAPVDQKLRARVIADQEVIECRPADLLAPELDRLIAEYRERPAKGNGSAATCEIDDILTYALFPQVGLYFLQNRGNPDAFEPPPQAENTKTPAPNQPGTPALDNPEPAFYRVRVDAKSFLVEVVEGSATPRLHSCAEEANEVLPATDTTAAEEIRSGLAGEIRKILVHPGQVVQQGEALLSLEAMKMEMLIEAPKAGKVASITVQEGDTVVAGDILITLA